MVESRYPLIALAGAVAGAGGVKGCQVQGQGADVTIDGSTPASSSSSAAARAESSKKTE